MNRIQRSLPFVMVLFALVAADEANAKTVNAPSCELTDVQAAVNSAGAGDTVVIPAGACTWTGGLSITKPVSLTGSGTANTSASTFGAGTTSTVITDDSVNDNLISVSGITAGQLVRVSLLDIEPTANTAVAWPIVAAGTCSASGCPSVRIDNILWGSTTAWTYEPTLETQTLLSVDNVFGVVDHNTVPPGDPNNTCPEFININHTSWQGVGAYGDNSWASPDTFGTEQAFYLENNDIWLDFALTENEFPVNAGTLGAGGGRVVGRFNKLTMVGWGPFAYHGTETSGRSRSGRAFEVYGNAMSCEDTACNGYVGLRGGTAFVFGNTWTLGPNTWINSILNIETQRTWRATGWSQCNGLTPFDVNDGYAQQWTGTIGSISGSGPYTITVSGPPLTSGAYDFSSSQPGDKFYIVWDSTAGWMAGINSNTASSLTSNFAIPSSPGWPPTNMSAGDAITIYSSKLYAAGTHTGVAGAMTLTDSTKSWMMNQWVGNHHGYSVINITQQSLSNQIGANTSNAITAATAPCCPAWNWNTGDAYIIAGYTRCLDQGGAGPGQLYSGNMLGPAAATTEVLDPAYEWDNAGDLTSHPNVGTDSPSTFVANVQYYTDNSGGNPVECTATHSCASLTEGVAWGKLAYRPTTCTAGVGYFATDQGNWNHSGNSFGQGQLFVCGPGNTWQVHYVPYCYPHPLVSGGQCASELPDAGSPDAGAAQPDAGAADGSPGSADAGPGTDAGLANGDGGANGSSASSNSSGCGCKLASPGPPRGIAVVFSLLGRVALVRRRHRPRTLRRQQCQAPCRSAR